MPVKSPQRPTGSRNMAVASKKAVITQLSRTASISKLFSIDGRAMLTEEIKNVPIKEVIATMASIETCFLVQFIVILIEATKIVNASRKGELYRKGLNVKSPDWLCFFYLHLPSELLK